MKIKITMLLLAMNAPAPALAQEREIFGTFEGVFEADRVALDIKGTLEVRAPGVSATASAGVSGSVVRAERDAGCGRTELSLEAELRAHAKIAAKAQAGAFGASGQVEAQAGTRSSYRATVPDALADAMRAGRIAPPNPFDPATMAPGVTVTLSRENFSSINAEFAAAFQQIQLSLGESHAKKSGNVVAVTRMDDRTVRVIAGPQESVSRASSVGFGIRSVSSSIASSRNLAFGDLTTWEFDVSSEEGREAYAQLLATGASSIAPSETVSATAFDQGATFTAGVAGKNASVKTQGSHRQTTTQRADGSRDVTIHADVLGATFSTHRTYAGGTPTGASIDVPLGRLTREQAALLAETFGTQVSPGEAVLRLTEKDVSVLRARARAYCSRNDCAWNPSVKALAEASSLESLGLALAPRVKDGKLVANLFQLAGAGRQPLGGSLEKPASAPACEEPRSYGEATVATLGNNVERSAATQRSVAGRATPGEARSGGQTR